MDESVTRERQAKLAAHAKKEEDGLGGLQLPKEADRLKLHLCFFRMISVISKLEWQ